MANRIMQLTDVDERPTSIESLQKYVDLDMDSTRNSSHKDIEFPMLSDYVAWLAAELHTVEPLDVSADLSAFAVKAPEATDSHISAIAVVLKTGYDTAYALYQKWMQPYKWRVSKLVNVKAVQRSLHNIFSWIPGERILNPEFGSKLRYYLYQGITQENQSNIVSEIKYCVGTWEPRVEITKVVNASTQEDYEDNTVHLEILYKIPSLSEEQYNYSFYYNRGE